MEEKKIAVINPRLYAHGGVPRVITELVGRLEEIEGLKFEIIVSRKSDEWDDKIDSEVTEISPYPYPHLAFFKPWIKKSLEEFDLVWTHNQFLNRLALTVDTPFLTTFHELNTRHPGFLIKGLSFKSKLESYIQEKGLKYTEYADRTAAISSYLKDEVSEIHKGEPVAIYHGGNLKHFEFSEEDDEFIFCTDVVDHTINRIAQEKPVKALGNGEYEDVEYLGNLSDKELSKNLMNSSFIVSGSGHDGFGIAPVEAAFCGKTCVVRAIGGHRETIKQGETGYLAENSKEFHEYVNQLWNSKQKRKKMGKNAYNHVKENFTWEIAASQYLTEINDLLKTDFELDN